MGKGIRHWACLTTDAGQGDQNPHLLMKVISTMTFIRSQSVSAPMFSHLEPGQMSPPHRDSPSLSRTLAGHEAQKNID